MSNWNMSILDADEVYALLQKKITELKAVVDVLDSVQRYIGVTTTVLTDGATTNPIEINGASVTAINGDAAIYNGNDFVFNGTIWQAVPQAFGALAYKNSASGSYTPAGTVSITPGTLPSISYDGNTETLAFDAGSLPGSTGSFSGTAATITVE